MGLLYQVGPNLPLRFGEEELNQARRLALGEDWELRTVRGSFCLVQHALAKKGGDEGNLLAGCCDSLG